MTMEWKTIQTLAEYIAKLHKTDQTLLHPEEYYNNPTDTNGVESDQVETFWPSNERWARQHLIPRRLGVAGQVALDLRKSMKIEISKVWLHI